MTLFMTLMHSVSPASSPDIRTKVSAVVLVDQHRQVFLVDYIAGTCELGETTSPLRAQWAGPLPQWGIASLHDPVRAEVYYTHVNPEEGVFKVGVGIRRPSSRWWGTYADGPIAHYILRHCDPFAHPGYSWVGVLDGASRTGRAMLTRLLWHDIATRSTCADDEHERAFERCWKRGRCQSVGATVDEIRAGGC